MGTAHWDLIWQSYMGVNCTAQSAKVSQWMHMVAITHSDLLMDLSLNVIVLFGVDLSLTFSNLTKYHFLDLSAD